MPQTKKAIDQSGLDKGTRKYLSETSNDVRRDSRGIAGDFLPEGVPKYITTKSEHVISNKNNSWIVLGRDRPGSRLSGYGGKGDTQAGSMDLVVGRMGYEARKVNKDDAQVYVDNSFKKDSARIYLSQKTDVDANFGLVEGALGNSKAKSAIAMKADGIRIIAREGIKFVTGTDLKNSQGGNISTIGGIELIAGNDDRDLQPLTKGDNVAEALKRTVHHLDKLAGIVDSFLMIQTEFAEAVTGHYHYSPYFSIPTTPAIDVVVPKGIKTMINQMLKVKLSLVNYKANLAAFKITYLTPAGSKYINSRHNKTT